MLKVINLKISVIIPVKNRAALLRLTLDNILSQSISPYEIIVVDDDSTDEIDKVIVDYKREVIFTKSEGKGPGAARNTGLRIATGNAIQFFDSDDLMTINKLKVQSELMNSTKADFVYGPFVKATNTAMGWEQNDVIMQYYPLPGGKMSDFVLEGWCNIMQSVLFSKDLIDEVGFLREDLITHEDLEYWFRIGKVVKKFEHENESCVIYRQHQNQITDQSLADQSRWLNELIASNYIKAGINYSKSLKSLALFKGRIAFSKLGYIRKFGKQANIKSNISELIYIPYFKFLNKKGRLATGNNWQLIHGTLESVEMFNKYVKLLTD